MEICLITFRSVTPAQRGEGALKREGFTCTLRRTPKWMEQKGCGYSLQLPCKEIHGAVQLLKKQKIPYQKIYRYQDGDRAEEWYL